MPEQKRAVPPQLLRQMFLMMLKIRRCEERIAELITAKEIRGPAHLCIGQEAIAAGVCAALTEKDYIFGCHRSHGHYLAKGGSLKKLMAELYGKSTGCSGGRGGSMHLIAPEAGVLGTVPLVAGTIPLAVGAALASKLRGEQRVTVSFFGDGATEEGVFHESMNLAAHRKLPVVLVCENNFYASHLHISERKASENIAECAAAYNIPWRKTDGNDCIEVYLSASEAVRRARDGKGPTLLEYQTFRWRGHVGPALDLDVGLKRRTALEEWTKKDPIPRLREALLISGVASQEIKTISQEVEKEIEEAVSFARESALPDVGELKEHVFWSEGRKV